MWLVHDNNLITPYKFNFVSMDSEPQLSQFNDDDFSLPKSQEGDDQIELEMLAQQCEELINKLGCNMQLNISANDDVSEQNEEVATPDVKRQKQRLEKQYLELCVEIERQQKQLDNFTFKIKVSSKEAEYYSRQIKQKQDILQNLQKCNSKKKKQLNSKK